MISSLRRALPALVALSAFVGALDCAHAAPQTSDGMKLTVLAMEMPVARITLPVSDRSPVVMPSCGDCPLRSFPTTANTIYYRDSKSITLSELKALALQYPHAMLTVAYVVATREIASITINPPAKSSR